MKKIEKIAICVTGGHYYSWFGGDHFYEWLNKFCNENQQFTPKIMSWRPPDFLPAKVKEQFGENIHYRENEGCDWGCYNHFHNYLTENSLTEEFDCILFVHDDIMMKDPNWPLYFVDHLNKNPQFDWVSFFGQYMTMLEDESKVKRDDNLMHNGEHSYKSVVACCFGVRANEKFFNNNPFVTCPGDNRGRSWNNTDPGDVGANVFMANVFNIWGASKVGWAAFEGTDLVRPEMIHAVVNFKRGRTVRKPDGFEDINNRMKWSFPTAELCGFKFKAGELATHPKLNSQNKVVLE